MVYDQFENYDGGNISVGAYKKLIILVDAENCYRVYHMINNTDSDREISINTQQSILYIVIDNNNFNLEIRDRTNALIYKSNGYYDIKEDIINLDLKYPIEFYKNKFYILFE